MAVQPPLQEWWGRGVGWGGGLRLGGRGLDGGFWTHTNSLSNERAITMATSLSIY